jgi:hypothetical protein
MRIREAQKHTDPTDTGVDPDPQHWLGHIFDMADITGQGLDTAEENTGFYHSFHEQGTSQGEAEKQYRTNG